MGAVRSTDADRFVGARMRERRTMLGITQHQMAELIGVSYQQVHKYEKGVNRVSAGRLLHFAQALGVEPGYFFEGYADSEALPPQPSKMFIGLAQDVAKLPLGIQSAICRLVRQLASDAGAEVISLDDAREA